MTNLVAVSNSRWLQLGMYKLCAQIIQILSIRGFASTMTVVYIVCGFAVLVFLFVAVKGFFMLKSRNQSRVDVSSEFSYY